MKDSGGRGIVPKLTGIALTLLATLLATLAGVWAGFALWHQLQAPTQVRVTVVAVLALALLVALKALWQRRWKPLVWFGVVFAGVLGWWGTLKPSHDRIWADDVARLLHVEVDGSKVRLSNVRNFDWRSETDYTVRWEEREYDLDHVVSADLVLSYWMGPTIAHTLVSFGFDDGRYLTLSVEIRKEKGESFSAIGGFFRKFETVLVAADERDIIRVRSNVRGEDVYFYRLQVSPPTLRAMFLGYAGEARKLEQAPAFYNTLTSNCTTIVFGLARAINPGLPLDYRLLASGHLGEYAYDVGGLAPGVDYATLRARGRITERARAAGDDPRFSELIRVGIPGIAAQKPPQ
ncbi:DUF4105 domain-containing protein [Herbaspirillum sp. RV1423]|uniref:Lnb N-terminal periplasmic domain-containing protein n=1 Tax=Herbaspirillum sp. RV1423 TaxID=1443993 RepID=UPI0005542755|nr:DUF4105 domain-containing protein [Herbaspirillum sp. RV1423]